jgi:hypothetical protein
MRVQVPFYRTKLTSWMAAFEETYRFILLEADCAEHRDWANLCIEQARPPYARLLVALLLRVVLLRALDAANVLLRTPMPCPDLAHVRSASKVLQFSVRVTLSCTDKRCARSLAAMARTHAGGLHPARGGGGRDVRRERR